MHVTPPLAWYFRVPETLLQIQLSCCNSQQKPHLGTRVRRQQMAHTKQIRRAVSLADSKPCTFVDASNTRNDLCELLDNIESGAGGSFVSYGVFNHAPLPDLDLQGFGPIPLPLARRDAHSLTKHRTWAERGRRSLVTWGINS